MTKKCLIVGPNAGLSMGKGGGCKVAVKMAEELLYLGFQVHLSAFKGYTIHDLDFIHNATLSKIRANIHTHYLISVTLNNKKERKRMLFLNILYDAIPPYAGVMFFSQYLKCLMTRSNFDLLIFHDDVPISIKHELSKKTSILYVHFSYATRLKADIWDVTKYQDPFLKRALSKAHRFFIKKCIFVDECPTNLIIANSSVTATCLRKTWNLNNVTIIHPPVDVKFFNSSSVKKNLIVSIGGIQPNKRFEDVLEAVKEIKSSELIIIGHLLSRKYYCHLLRFIKRLELENRVKILCDIDQEQMSKILSKAKILVHASNFEPFGISVVEGMASGCVPVVYNGPMSGPWIDIVNKGEYGLGFQDVNELVATLEKLLSDDETFKKYQRKAIERARNFDVSCFKKKFHEYIVRAYDLP
jgi:glycosyltransferase involved in cell wall biosynthesis